MIQHLLWHMLDWHMYTENNYYWETYFSDDFLDSMFLSWQILPFPLTINCSEAYTVKGDYYYQVKGFKMNRL